MAMIHRSFPDSAIEDVPLAVRRAMEKAEVGDRVQPGARIALAAGSRGIDRIAEVFKAAGEILRGMGAKPFVVAAMGSHGGATPHGQKKVLEDMGKSEDSVGMPVISDMKTVEIGKVGDVPVFVDEAALKADGVLAINRIKPHTSVVGNYGSGLCKMLVVGLGKKDGAERFHRLGPDELEKYLPEMAGLIIEKANVIGGLGLVEDSRDKLSVIEAAKPEDIPELDRELLEKAEEMMPRLPFDELDVLVVCRMGKDVSGTGMDANVIGRRGIRTIPDPPSPRIRRIAALGLTEKSGGNAHGIGMADFVTEKLINSVDWDATRSNAMASSFPEKGMAPLAMASDREAIEAALQTAWVRGTASARMVIIKNTLQLDKIMVSKPLLDEVSKREDVTRESDPGPLQFNKNGDLIMVW